MKIFVFLQSFLVQKMQREAAVAANGAVPGTPGYRSWWVDKIHLKIFAINSLSFDSNLLIQDQRKSFIKMECTSFLSIFICSRESRNSQPIRLKFDRELSGVLFFPVLFILDHRDRSWLQERRDGIFIATCLPTRRFQDIPSATFFLLRDPFFWTSLSKIVLLFFTKILSVIYKNYKNLRQ